MNKYSIVSTKEDDFLTTSRIPVILWILLVYVTALVAQYIEDFAVVESIMVFFVFLIHIFLYWIAYKFQDRMNWYYLLTQGTLVFVAASLLPDSSYVVLIGLLSLLVAQSIEKLQSILKALTIFILYYLVYCIFIITRYGINELPRFLLVFLFILIIVIGYSSIYSRQVKTRIRMEYYLEELSLTHQKVEELTLLNERQRMARDLHDTLAQGVAGLVMQLEAIDAHLSKNNVEKSQSIVRNSMRQARETLNETRKAIDNLRGGSNEYKNFQQAVNNMLEDFEEFSGIHVLKEINKKVQLSEKTIEHCLYILSECLTNIVKHAHAQEVTIVIKASEKNISMAIKDDGIGFNVEKRSKQSGKYGLLGLNERVRLLNGELMIRSVPTEGTEVTVIVPI